MEKKYAREAEKRRQEKEKAIARLRSPDTSPWTKANILLGMENRWNSRTENKWERQEMVPAIPTIIELLGRSEKFDINEKRPYGVKMPIVMGKRVGSFAADVLIKIGEPAVDPLLEKMNTLEKKARLDAIRVLGRIRSNNPRVAEAIDAASKDADNDIRKVAVTELNKKMKGKN